MMRLNGPITLIPAMALSSLASCAQNPAQETDWTDASPHQVRFVTTAPEVQLEVLDWGGDGDNLVFLAGLSMNAHSFDDFAPRFTDTHRVLGITRRGHGASTWPDSGYSIERLVEDIRIVLDTLGIERAVLAGHSFGGDEITRFASEYPDRVEGLVYIDAGYDGSLINRLRVFEICPMGPEIMEAIERRFENLEAFRHTQRRVGADGTLVPYVSNAAASQMMASSSTPAYSSVVAPALAVYHTPKWVEDIMGGEAQLSADCASAMQRVTYESIAAFAVGMRNARIVALDDTQHNIHLVSPDALEEAMRRWLATRPDGR
jgi:pimeloyl-ACP methyl ester carboxylesterase